MTETNPADRTDRRQTRPNRQTRQTMADVSHVHPDDPGVSVRVFSRGPRPMTDGGRRADHETTETDEDEEEERAEPGRRMKDVSHTPPTGDREVNRVFERGAEGRADER